MFKDPLAPKKVERGQVDRKGPLKPGEFKAPSYDNRTSCSVSAGDEYGIGHRTPVGKEKPSSISSGPIPQKAFAYDPYVIFDRQDKEG
jgi:hypothetical protein